MVMEYLAGGTLKDKLAAYEAEGKTMSLEETAVILDKVSSGLDYAHQRGIIHRDIKPANILFADDGEPIIADFGIVKLLNETAVLDANGWRCWLAPLPPPRTSDTETNRQTG